MSFKSFSFRLSAWMLVKLSASNFVAIFSLGIIFILSYQWPEQCIHKLILTFITWNLDKIRKVYLFKASFQVS